MTKPKFEKFAKASQKNKSKISYKYVILYILLLILVFGYYYMNKNMAEQTAVPEKIKTQQKPTTFIMAPADETVDKLKQQQKDTANKPEAK